jgi:hypothetical protein
MNSTTSTVPLRCPACGEQTHKTLDSVNQDGGFVCQCGVRSELDLEQFVVEIEKSERKIKDFGRNG